MLISRRQSRYILSGVILVAAIGLAVSFLTGCSPKTEVPITAPSAISEPVETPEAAVANPLIHPFGETHDYGTGVTISVSEPTEFTPTNISAGANNAFNVYWAVTITNNSDQPYEPSPFPKVSSGGATASMIADVDNPVGELNSPPAAPILPGKSLTFLSAYSVDDLNDLIYAIAPDFMYDEAIFTNSQ